MNFKSIYDVVEAIKCIDIYELLAINNKHLIYENDITAQRFSVLLREKDQNTIFLHSGLDFDYETFLILHELGHFYLQANCSLLWASKQSRSYENEANIFACLYLLKNDIWLCSNFATYLDSVRVPIKISNYIEECIFQYKQTCIFGDNWLRMEC